MRSYGRIAVENQRFRSNGSVDPKFHLVGVAPTDHSSCQKTRINYLWYDIKILPQISIAWVGCTNVTDRRQTDRQQTDARRHIANVNSLVSSRSLKIVFTKFYAHKITIIMQFPMFHSNVVMCQCAGRGLWVVVCITLVYCILLCVTVLQFVGTGQC